MFLTGRKATGLREANIKSSKSILQRIMKTTVMTYEELSTLFCQIEAVLNSRPLGTQSMGCKDYNALTPGHFLIGRALDALPTGYKRLFRISN